MSDTSLVFNLVSRDRASAALDRIREKLSGVGATVAKVSGAGLAIPGLAAAVTGAAGLAAGMVAAGLAAKAFQAAAVPQLESVTEAWDLYSAAQEAAVKGGDQAQKAQEAYNQALAQMTPATRDTATAFIGLKNDYSAWSDSLSGTTMPVFTKGIELLRDLLPTLTPFVQAAAGALGNFVDEIAAGTKSAGFKQWAADMSGAAGPALSDFLTLIKNLGVGFGGLLQAFLPASAGMTGGLVEMSGAFAQWGSSLPDSAGFASFLDTAATGADTLGMVAGAAGNVLVAVAPLLGTTVLLANGFAKVVNATPTPVLTAIAVALVTVKVGMLAYSAVTTVVAARNAIMAASQTPVILGWLRMNAVGVAAMVRIAATSAIAAGATAAAWAGSALASIGAWIAAVVRAAVVSSGQYLLMAGRAVIWGATMAAQWLIAFWPIALVTALIVGLVVLVIAKWDTIKAYTAAAWNAVWAKVRAAAAGVLAAAGWLGRLPGRVGGWFGRMKDVAVQKAVALVSWMVGWPGRISRAVGSLSGLLTSKGRAVVQGLWSGIQQMGGWIRSKIIGWAKSVIPGPIAKALGIASPSKVTRAQGRWIARGLMDGLTGSSKQVRAASYKLVDIVRDSLSGSRRTKALKTINRNAGWLDWLALREEKVTARLKTANKKLADLIKDRDKLAADVKKGVLDSANITSIAGDGAVGADTILTSLQDKLARAKQWTADLAQMVKKGVRGDLIAQIAQAGVEQGSGAAAALAGADKNTIRQINSTQAQLVAAAGKAGSVAGNAMYGAGIQAARGLVDGLASEQKTLEKGMIRVAKSMQSAIKKALGIRSPSTVMAEQVGKFIPPGVAEGMQRTAPQLDAAMRSLVRPELAMPARPVAAPGMAPLVGAQAASGTTRVVIDVRGADEDLKKLFRKLVRVDGRGSAQTAFGR